MADKDQDYRIFVGGLSWDVTERQLESAFSRFGKIVDSQSLFDDIMSSHMPDSLKVKFKMLDAYRVLNSCGVRASKLMLLMLGSSPETFNPGHRAPLCSSAHIVLERDTGRPRGFGFLTFSDRRGMEDAIRDMHGRELGDRVISVNKAQPKGADGPGHGYGSHPTGGRGSFGGRDRPAAGQDDCYKCGRPGHWARDCPAGGGRGARPLSPPRKYGGAPSRGDRYTDDRDRYVDDRYDRGRYGDRDHIDNRDYQYGRPLDRYINDRYAPTGERITADRYSAPADRYPLGYGRDRAYDKDGGVRGAGDRYGGGPGPARFDGRSYRERPAPYDRPRRGGRPLSLERY